MLGKIIRVSAIMAAGCATLLADFSYQDTSTVTGGALATMLKVVGVFSKQAREPMQSKIAVKGDKMAHRSANTASIIDLGAQTITTVDYRKKTYSVMTFDQMKQMLDQMSQQMKANNQGQLQFKVSIDRTGKTQQIGGAEAKEVVLKMEMEGTDQQTGQKGSMVMTSDMWIAPAAPGYSEVRDFYKRMAEKIDWTPGGNMFMVQSSDATKGMAELYKEAAKMDGMPVLQFISMGTAGPPGAAPAGDQAAPPPQQEQQQTEEKPSVSGALSGALGGHFGLGRKKSKPPKEDTAAQPASGSKASGGGSLLEMKSELSDFSSSAADDALFSVPAGFKQVEPNLKRAPR